MREGGEGVSEVGRGGRRERGREKDRRGEGRGCVICLLYHYSLVL